MYFNLINGQWSYYGLFKIIVPYLTFLNIWFHRLTWQQKPQYTNLCAIIIMIMIMVILFKCMRENVQRQIWIEYVSARWSITCICTTCKSNYIHTLIYTINIHVLITLHLLSVEKIQKKKIFNLSDRMSVKFLSLFAFMSKHLLSWENCMF